MTVHVRYTDEDARKAAAAQAKMEEQPDVQAAQYAHELVRAMKPAFTVGVRFAPERIGEVAALQPDLPDEIRALFAHLRRWMDGVEDELRKIQKVRRVK
jgi:hypothetical protein